MTAPAGSVVTRVRNALLRFRYLIEFLTQPERRQLKALIVAGSLTTEDEIQDHLGALIFDRSTREPRARIRIAPRRPARPARPAVAAGAAVKPKPPRKPRRKKRSGAHAAVVDSSNPATVAGPGTEHAAPAEPGSAPAEPGSGGAASPAPAATAPDTDEAAGRRTQAKTKSKPRSRAKPKPEEPTVEDAPAKLVGKVIDVETRRPIAQASIRVIGTKFQGETETTGTFFWEELPRAKALNLEFTHKDYRPQIVNFRSSLDDYQYLNVKLAPRETKYERRKRRMAEW